MFIKRVQREYKERFKETLEIDWNKMNGITEPFIPYSRSFNEDAALSKLNDLCNIHSTDIATIRNNNLRGAKFRNEQYVLFKWCRWIRENGYFEGEASKLINKDRSLIYYYSNAKKGISKTKRKE